MLFSKKGRKLALMTACLLACQACSAETAAQGTPEKKPSLLTTAAGSLCGSTSCNGSTVAAT